MSKKSDFLVIALAGLLVFGALRFLAWFVPRYPMTFFVLFVAVAFGGMFYVDWRY